MAVRTEQQLSLCGQITLETITTEPIWDNINIFQSSVFNFTRVTRGLIDATMIPVNIPSGPAGQGGVSAKQERFKIHYAPWSGKEA